MADQIFIGNFGKGLTKNRLPFVIDNDAFPTMENFYSWRGRAKRKRGTYRLGQLSRQIESAAAATNWKVGPIVTLDGSGDGSFNLVSTFSLQATSSIKPGSISFSDGTNTYTDDSAGILTGAPGGTGTINYSTSAGTITGGALNQALIGTFSYYPGLPVMGLKDQNSNAAADIYPLLMAFDTTYSYQIQQTASANSFYSTSFYKNSNNPVTWNGQDYNQFWTCNYQSAFWAINDNPGMQYEPINTIVVGATTTINTSAAHGLVTGDYVFFYEITGVDAADLNGLALPVTVTSTTQFTVAVVSTGHAINNDGIFQTLTSTSTTSSGDGIRWYDGDMTNSTGLPVSTTNGWVNFAPPLTATGSAINIDTIPAAQYYLVGAVAVLPFKDRLIFFGAYVQASGAAPIHIKDSVVWSWNGTPYYNAVIPQATGGTNLESFDLTSWYVDTAGKGGYLSSGTRQLIVTVGNDQDVLLVGFDNVQTRFVYTGNDLNPFLFYLINSELGSSSTFSSVDLDQGSIYIGANGIAIVDQQSAKRVDLQIPDEVFRIQALNNGAKRVNSIRDYLKEWAYFSYPEGDGDETENSWTFPTKTFLFNYRDNTWAILKENFTAHGTFRKSAGYTWATIGTSFPTWNVWNEAWNSGAIQPQIPSVIGGNPQGYVLVIGEGTGEGESGTIESLADNGTVTITSTNHCVNTGDYLYLTGALNVLSATITAATQATQCVLTCTSTFALGNSITISGVVGMTELNGNTYKIIAIDATTITLDVDSTGFTAYSSTGTATGAFNNQVVKVGATVDADTFDIDLLYPEFNTSPLSGYLGLGKYARLSVPKIQTRQFPVYWEQGRQVRIGVQRYLFDRTAAGQVTLGINLSQDPDLAYNSGDPSNDGLIYSDILYTSPETDNLQTPTAATQYQIWQRINTSLIGETFQLTITLSDAQMRDYELATSDIVLQSIQLTVYPGPYL